MGSVAWGEEMLAELGSVLWGGVGGGDACRVGVCVLWEEVLSDVGAEWDVGGDALGEAGWGGGNTH